MPIVLLVATSGDVGLPLGMYAWLGTGEARMGGDVAPLAVAVGLTALVPELMRTWLMVMSLVSGAMTRATDAVPMPMVVLMLVLARELLLGAAVESDIADNGNAPWVTT